jgi:WS/DGAT/MGAT family acyltransferase
MTTVPAPARTVRRDRRSPVDRATSADLVMLALDRRDVPEQVAGILLLDGGPAFDLRIAEATLAERIEGVPRLRQRLVSAPPGCGRPVWIDDAGFDITRHVRQLPCPASGDEQALLDVGVRLVADPLPHSRPLWSAAFVTGLAGDRVALVLVLHHVLADGIGGLAVLDVLVDTVTPEPLTGVPVQEFPRRPPSTAELAVDAWRSRVRALSRLPTVWRRVRASVAAAGGLRPGRAAGCSLLRPAGPRRRLAVVRADLAPLRAAAHRTGGTVNDVVLAAVAGALHAVLEHRGESVDAFVISVPVAIRRSATVGQLGNRVSPMLVSVPGDGAVEGRVRLVAAQTRVRKAAATEVLPPALIGPVFRVAARLGLVHRYMCRQRQLHTLVTNLHGPDRPLTFAGAPVDDLIPVALGDPGNATVSFDVLSYAGTLSITVVADPDHVPDLPLLAAALQAELAAAGTGPPAAERSG